MKLRLQARSLRIRVSYDEVRQLASQGHIEEQVPLTPQRSLIYRLRVAPQAERMAVRFEDDVIEIGIPEWQAHEWCTSDLVSLAETQPNAGAKLTILLEKDFDASD